jgi:hypothetical protein
MDKLNALGQAVGLWLINTVDSILVWLNLEVNIINEIGVIAAVFFIIFVLLLIAWHFQDRGEPRRHADFVSDEYDTEYMDVQNGLTPRLGFPTVFKLFWPEDVGEEKRGVGYIIQKEPGEESLLFFEGGWTKLATLQSLHHLIIDKIESELQGGVRLSDEEKTEKNHFELNGVVWKVYRTLPFVVRVEKGAVYSFPGGEGAIELFVASRANGEGSDDQTIVLEKQFSSFRRKVNETWKAYFASEVFEEEARNELGELFDELELTS